MGLNKNKIVGFGALILAIIGTALILIGILKYRDHAIGFSIAGFGFYAIAWEERTGEKVNRITILTTTEDGELDVHRDDPSNHIVRLEEMIEEYKTGKIGEHKRF